MQKLVEKWCLWVHHRLVYNLETVLTGFGRFHTWGLDSNGESNSIRKRRKQSTFSLGPMEPVCSLILEGGASNATCCQPKKAPTQCEQHEELGSHPVCSCHPMQVVNRESMA